MEVWDRQTPWRQGHFLTNETAMALGFFGSEGIGSKIVIVVSHDCDIAQDPKLEPEVEIIVGVRVDKPNGNFTHAKNPRRIHLRGREKELLTYVELDATGKTPIPKDRLFAHKPSADVELVSGEHSILQRWLGIRYHRAAFPDKFDRMLQNRKLDKALVKILDPCGNEVIAVFFDLQEEPEDIDGSADTPYPLSIFLLYSTATDPIKAERDATAAAEAIIAAFKKACFDNDTNSWKDIELLECAPMADEVMTYADSLRLRKWQIDYISFRAEPMQPMAPEVVYKEKKGAQQEKVLEQPVVEAMPVQVEPTPFSPTWLRQKIKNFLTSLLSLT